jgi:transcriptional antiterminator RfaH
MTVPQNSIAPTACWHVVHTRPRQEKALARTLTAAGVEHYLPLHERVRFRGRRKIVVHEPLFPSYLFLLGPVEATWMAIETRRVANVISVADQTRFTHELDQIRKVLSAGAELGPYRFLEVGRRVRVTSGPFKDIEGLVEAWQKSNRLVLQIQALGRAASLEIDAGLLEPVDTVTPLG